MAAEKILNRRGQSILEVIFAIPVLLLFVALMFKANMAAQISINNAQYARAQVFTLTANSPNYPRLGYTQMLSSVFSGKEQDRLVMGVSDPMAIGAGASGSMEPIPQRQKIARASTSAPGSTDSGEPKLRTELRIRNTSAICTQLNSAGKGPMNSKNINASLGAQYWPFGMGVCRYNGI